MKHFKYIINEQLALFLLLVGMGFLLQVSAQQDPQYTQYMYNTMSVNPAYAGSKGHAVITGLVRTQWVGIKGAPNTQTLSYDTPLGFSGVGLGINLVNDKLGPSNETYLDANVSYAIKTSDQSMLSFGLKAGGRLFNINWEKGTYQNPEKLLQENVDSKFLPTIGAGIFHYSNKWYLGLSVPNFLNTEHYDDTIESVALERMHFFFIGGYVFDLSKDIKFKPALLFKGVSGAPASLDISANFLFYDRFRAGVAWRWDDSVSTLLGFQVSESFHIGYAYDLTTSNYSNYNSGSHEIMLQYEIFRRPRVLSPRFF